MVNSISLFIDTLNINDAIKAELKAITSITSWCLLGKFLRRFAENKKFIQRFNYAMSFSLIVCVILIYLKI